MHFSGVHEMFTSVQKWGNLFKVKPVFPVDSRMQRLFNLPDILCQNMLPVDISISVNQFALPS